MNPADGEAAKLVPTEGQLDERLRVSVEALLHPSPSAIPADDVDGLLLAISHHLDAEASERKKIYNRLLAIQSEMEGLTSGGLTRYLAALCIALAVILAWQSYGEATKQIIATRAPELGWSPESKQRIASWVQQLGWTKPVESKAAPVQTAPATVAAKQSTTAPDPQQVKQIETEIAALREAVERHLADMRATVERLAAGVDEVNREIGKLEVADEEILQKISPAPPPPRSTAAPARKPTPTAPSRSHAPIPPRPLSHP
jgi:hypothetical protein